MIVALPGLFSYHFLATFPEHLNSLNECSYNKTCLSGFQDLPEELVKFAVDIPEPILHSTAIFYNECGLPIRQIIKMGNLMMLEKNTPILPLTVALIGSVFFVTKGNLFDVYFTTLQLVQVSYVGGRTSTRTSP